MKEDLYLEETAALTDWKCMIDLLLEASKRVVLGV